ncbi:hypothetical protein QUB80_11555 [Chlorogloeopsis sp. ULAP01]|jgi:putative transposase|uniref:transposase n=1 Tax=Chlorogloeopsis sp. ULAP01 TaxID=3056483 RepID=UPI0025AB4581|nr:transposase [Chlorogloeopsis sp. ULAP01]MDM9381338.1 hypothetical protein [Chlorogloeopsis sp. ULAP01]
MKYNPEKHHRRSIRLQGYNYSQAGAYFITICTSQRECLFGEIVDEQMKLNNLGKVAQWYWRILPKYHPRLLLDDFVFMPNHLHGILILTDDSEHEEGEDFANCDRIVGAGLTENLSVLSKILSAKPAPTGNSTIKRHHGIPEIIRGFKTFSARRINQIRCTPGISVWQRNYYEQIIHNEIALNTIRQYIANNPSSWEIDQLHPQNPSKW